VSKHQEPIEAPNAGAALSSDIQFKDRDFNTAQLLQLFSCGKTTLFQEIIPHLEIYYEGSRLKATGRSIIKYRERKLAEPRVSRPMPEHHEKKRRRRETEGAVIVSSNDPRPDPPRQQEQRRANTEPRKKLQHTRLAPRR
jgi:hypothetical protein